MSAILIGGKEALPSQPYVPQLRRSLVGRQPQLEMITAAWMAGSDQLPLSPLLLGEPGVGKNHLVYELASRTGKKLYIFQGHEDVTAEDLACAVRFRDDGQPGMDYVASPLLTAMESGDICFIDEIAKIRPRALALLVSVLDERRYLDSILLGERVHAKPGFRFIAATNTADLEGNAMPEFLRSRMRPVIRVGFPDRQQIAEMVTNLHPRVGRANDLLDVFWMEWDQRFGTKPDARQCSPRDAIYIFSLASSLADFDALGGPSRLADVSKTLSLNETDQALSVTVEHLKKAFQEMFPADSR
ncbi:MAG: AAA family ATPase [Planctomycetota bacterium]